MFNILVSFLYIVLFYSGWFFYSKLNKEKKSILQKKSTKKQIV